MLGTEPAIKENYVASGQVRLVFHHILDHGNASVQASQGAVCAGEQGLFWPMHDQLFENMSAFFGTNALETTKAIATQVPGLDTAAFNVCMDEQRYASLVQAQDQQRREAGIRTRPTLDINGEFVIGAQPFEAVQPVIESALP